MLDKSTDIMSCIIETLPQYNICVLQNSSGSMLSYASGTFSVFIHCLNDLDKWTIYTLPSFALYNMVRFYKCVLHVALKFVSINVNFQLFNKLLINLIQISTRFLSLFVPWYLLQLVKLCHIDDSDSNKNVVHATKITLSVLTSVNIR